MRSLMLEIMRAAIRLSTTAVQKGAPENDTDPAHDRKTLITNLFHPAQTRAHAQSYRPGPPGNPQKISGPGYKNGNYRPESRGRGV